MPTTYIGIDQKTRQEFEALAKTLSAVGKGLSEALSSGNSLGNLKGMLEKAKETAQSLTKDKLREVTNSFKDIGIVAQLSATHILEFAEAQTEAFKVNVERNLLEYLNSVQRATKASTAEIQEYARSIHATSDIIDQLRYKHEFEHVLDDFNAKMANAADKNKTKFYDETLPEALNKTSDAFADVFAPAKLLSSVIFFRKNSKETSCRL